MAMKSDLECFVRNKSHFLPGTEKEMQKNFEWQKPYSNKKYVNEVT